MIHTRRFLGLPAWLWPALAACFTAATVIVPPPTSLPEPIQESAIFRPPVLITTDAAGYRAVAPEERSGVTPLWSISPTVTAECRVSREFGPNDAGFGLGFFHTQCRWRYRLAASRFDVVDGKSDPWLSESESPRLRPLAVDELNRRSGNERVGDRLANLLDWGSERESRMCYQNLIVVCAWVAVLLALPAIWKMVAARDRSDTVS